MFSHLEKIRGVVAVSNAFLYFQPHNTCKFEPIVHKAAINTIKDAVKSRYLNQENSLEVYFYGGSSVLLLFDSQTTRDNIYTKLGIKAPTSIQRKTKSWEKGEISNYDYLMELNRLAGRTVNDLSLYPVLPWIIKDYLNNSDQLSLDKQETFRDLSQPISLKSFYSTPESVLSILARSYPERLLQLNKGAFGTNIVTSIPQLFDSIVKNGGPEAIPELYDGDGSFLMNSKSINFGTINNNKVHHVTLPSWAQNPYEFVATNRQALESEHVTERLHEWIDIIFGHKSAQVNKSFNPTIVKARTSATSGFHLNQEEKELLAAGQAIRVLFNEPHPKRTLVNRASETKILAEEKEQLKKNITEERETHEKFKQQKEKELKAVASQRDEAVQQVVKLEEQYKEIEQVLTTEKTLRVQEASKWQERVEEMEQRTSHMTKEIKKFQQIATTTTTTTTNNNNTNNNTTANSSNNSNNTPVTPVVTPVKTQQPKQQQQQQQQRKQPDEAKYINKYILQLERELSESKRNEQLREKELEQTHKLLLEYKNKYDDRRERSEKYFSKMCEMKNLQSEIQQLKNTISELKLQNEEKESTIHKLTIGNNAKEEELRNLRTENRHFAMAVNSLEEVFKDKFRLADQVKLIKNMDSGMLRIKEQFLMEDDIQIPESARSATSTNSSDEDSEEVERQDKENDEFSLHHHHHRHESNLLSDDELDHLIADTTDLVLA
jgi:hypothetical protein